MHAHPQRIIVIAEEPAAHAVLSALAAPGAGLLPEACASLPAARAALSAGPVAALLLDEPLLERDPAAWDALASAEQLPPIIFLTASADANADMRAAHAVDSVPRDPLDPALLRRAVRYAVERASAAAALATAQEQHAQLASLVTAAGDAIVRVDQHGRITLWNRGARQLYGWPANAAIGQPLSILLHPGADAEAAELLGLIRRGRRLSQHETIHRRRDGSSVDVSLTLSPITSAGARLAGAALIVRDISVWRQAQAATRDSEARLSTVLEHSRDVIYQINLQTGAYAYGSASTLEVLGYTREEFLASDLELAHTLIYPEDYERFRAHTALLLQPRGAPEPPPTIEYRFRTKHRGWRWLSNTRRVIHGADGQPVALVGNLRDITESKQLLDTTRYNLQRFRRIVETTHEGVFVIELPDTITYINNRMASLLGYTSRELLGGSLLSLVVPAEADALLGQLRDTTAAERPEYDAQLRHRDGTSRWCRISVSPMLDDAGAMIGAFGMVQDITERKRAEEDRDRLAAVLQATPDCVATLTADFGLLSINPAGRAMLGLPADADLGVLTAQRFLPAHFQHSPMHDAVAVAIRDGYWSGENTLVALDGREIAVSQVLIAHKDAHGAVQYFSTIARDITRRVLTEVALRQSEARKAAILQSSLEAIVSIDHQGTLLEFNPAAERIFGYRRDAVIGTSMADALVPVRWRQQHNAGIRHHVATGEGPLLNRRVELTALHADGHEFPIEIAVTSIAGENDGFPIYTSFIRDITDIKQAEQALAESQQRLQLALQAANVGLWDSDLDLNITTFSAEWKRQIGYADHELDDNTDVWDSRVHPDDYPGAVEAVRRAIAGETPSYQHEFRLRHKDGSYRWIVSQALVARHPDGTAARMIGAHLDITERKQAEHALRESEARLKQAQQIAGLGSFELDVRSNTIVWSDEVYRIMGCEPGTFEITPERLLELTHPDDRATLRQYIADAVATGSAPSLDHRIVRPDGALRYVSAQVEIVRDGDGAVQRLVGTLLDVTERKAAQEAVERNEKLYHTLASNFPNGSVYLLDRNLRVLLAEGQGMRRFGIAPADTVGKTIADFFPLPAYAALEQLLRRALANEPGHLETRIGREWREIYAVPIRDDSDDVTQVLVMTQDITARLKADAALRKSEARLRRAQSVARLGSWEWEEHTDTTECSPELLRIFGLAPDAALTRATIGARVHPADRAAAEAFFARLERSGASAVELRIVRPDESVRYVSAQAENIFDEQGRLERTLGTVLDITESKAVEETLVYQANLLQNVSDAIIATDLEQRITSWNRAAETLYGWSAAEVVGRTAREILRPEYGATSREEILREFAAHGSWTGEAVQRRKDGTPIDVLASVTLLRDHSGAQVGMVAVNRDITEFKQATAAVQASHERLEITLHSAKVGLWEWDVRAQTAHYSPQWKSQLGYADSEITNTREEWQSRIHPDDAERTAHKLQSYMTSPDTSYRNEYRLLHRDGSYRWMLAQGTIFRDEAGALLRIVGTQVDITELKQAEAELIRSRAELQLAHDELEARVRERTYELELAKDEAEQANAAKSEFLSRMSHELRTPMNSILGFAQIMEMDALSAKQAERLSYIMQAGRHLLQLINEVLDMARVEAGRLRVTTEPVVVQQTIQLAIDLVRPLVAQRGQQLVYDAMNQPLLYAQADQQRLAQILLNLLSNATKYSGEGDTIRIEVERRPARRLRIAIADSGPGIAEEHRARLFQPFERLHASGSVVEGTGLGLALSKRLAELMGGTLDVETQVGHGSRFWIELPEADAAGGSLNAERDDAPRPSRTILYIERELTHLDIVEHVVDGRSSLTLVTAESGSAGLELAKQCRPDLILLDLQLADLPGDEMLRRLRAAEATRDVPIVVLGTDATPHRIRRLAALGASDYLTKPLDVRLFGDIVNSTMQKAEETYAP